MKAYQQYQDSGTDYLSGLPSHWKIERGRFVFNYDKGKTPDETSHEKDTTSPIYLSMDYLRGDESAIIYAKDVSKCVHVKDGETLLLWDGANAGEFIRGKEGVLSSTMVKINLNRKMIDSYGWYLFSHYEAKLRGLTIGMGVPHVNSLEIKDNPLPLPPLSEQRQIAAYLDYKTTQIDRFITNRKKQIELLEERKAKTIERAILRGIDKGVNLKVSGFDWIGQIPNHWEIWKLKFLARITTGNKDTVDREDDGQYPFYVRSDNVERISTYSFDGEAILTAGDGVGVAKVFHYANGKFDFHQRVYCIYNFRKVLGKYAYYFIKTNFIKEVKKQSALTTVDSLRLPMLSNIQITLPPINEQKLIIEYIESELNDYEELISKYQKQIDLMQEYKTSLISKAVTGKIDVREWQPKQIISETV